MGRRELEVHRRRRRIEADVRRRAVDHRRVRAGERGQHGDVEVRRDQRLIAVADDVAVVRPVQPRHEPRVELVLELVERRGVVRVAPLGDEHAARRHAPPRRRCGP